MQEWQEKIEQEVGQLKEEVKQLKEQRTEEMRAINVNVASQDVITRLDKLEQELNTHSNTWLNTLQEHYTEHKQDITDVQTVQRGHSKFFEEHGKRLAATATKNDLSKLETRLDATATKDDIRRIEATQEQILKLLQQKSGE